MSNTKKGIDVSEWQKEIDWEKVKPRIDFAIIRLGLGQNTPDAYAKRNISECNRLGIPYGVYWFSYAYNVARAKNEANKVLELLKAYNAKPTFGIWFDWEYDSRNHAAKQGFRIGNALLRDMAKTFCDTIRAAGYEAGIYANGDYLKNYYTEAFLSGYPLWFAYLTDKPGRDVRIHQYSGSGKVEGISGNVDLDAWYDPPADGFSVKLATLRRGDQSEQVRAMQILLAGRGCNGKMHTPDGKFGPNTEGAVKDFQRKNGLNADGIAGPKTWEKLLGM